MRITGRQVDGVIVFVLITAVICLLSFLSVRPTLRDAVIVHGDPRDGSVVVKLSGDISQGGIYYLPDHTSLSRLLDIAGIKHQDRIDKGILKTLLVTGQMVTLNADHHLRIGWMDAKERLALDLPIDLNRATVEDLVLIPGIGEKTAAGIVRFRETSGPFRKMADLMNVPGIKEKKLAKWERYFYLPP